MEDSPADRFMEAVVKMVTTDGPHGQKTAGLSQMLESGYVKLTQEQYDVVRGLIGDISRKSYAVDYIRFDQALLFQRPPQADKDELACDIFHATSQGVFPGEQRRFSEARNRLLKQQKITTDYLKGIRHKKEAKPAKAVARVEKEKMARELQEPSGEESIRTQIEI
jgi:hypothetical protein